MSDYLSEATQEIKQNIDLYWPPLSNQQYLNIFWTTCKDKNYFFLSLKYLWSFLKDVKIAPVAFNVYFSSIFCIDQEILNSAATLQCKMLFASLYSSLKSQELEDILFCHILRYSLTHTISRFQHFRSNWKILIFLFNPLSSHEQQQKISQKITMWLFKTFRLLS